MEGRPLKYNDPKELEKLINNYFDDCDKKEKPYTITGLGISLGMDRRAICDYATRDSFTTLIWNAKKRCEEYAEMKLFSSHSSGAIFALKNYGWEDKKSIESADVTKDKYESWLKENQEALRDVTPEVKKLKNENV